MSIIWTIIIGFIAGIVAKFLHPGSSNEPSGFILTAALGIAGSFVATYLGQALGWYRAGEGAGFIGAVVVLLLYFLILMRLIQNAQTAADLPGTLIVMGVVAVLIFQIAVNIGMVIGLMPVTGIPLPLMSYGGSSVLFTFLALGMVMNVRMSRFVN